MFPCQKVREQYSAKELYGFVKMQDEMELL